MMNINKLLSVLSTLAIFLSFVTVIIPSTLLASGKISIENEEVSAVIEKFKLISSIPRCSKNEKYIAGMLKEWSKANDLKYEKDSNGNVLIKVQATKGFENSPTIVLQGHLDMVCEKIPDSDHDFKKDPIELRFDGDWLSAPGTTLGADNGIGIALCMALVENKNVSHPPLELLFTVEEETGLKGAAKMKSGFIKGKVFINVDSEDESYLTIGSAGGTVTVITMPTATKKLPMESELFSLQVSGLRGGHSGVDIHESRGNSIKILAGAMDLLNNVSQIRLVNLNGGSRVNAIPRDALASLVFDSGVIDRFQEIVATYEKNIKNKYASTEPNVSITLTEAHGEKTKKAITPEDTQNIINLIKMLPDGVFAMSSEFEGNVETSNNIGTAHFEKNNFVVISMERSADMGKIDGLNSLVQSVAKKTGAKAKIVEKWSAWKQSTDSELLQRSIKVYNTTFGQDPKFQLVHAGLECSVIAAKIPEMNMIAIGPTIENAHSPDERLNIPSVGNVWKFLTALLASYDQ